MLVACGAIQSVLPGPHEGAHTNWGVGSLENERDMSGRLKFISKSPSVVAVDYDYVDGLDRAAADGGGGASNGVYGRGGYAYGGHAASAHDRSGYGHSGGGHGHKEACCDLVVDPLLFLTLLGFIFFATYFLNTVITMDTMLPPSRRRRRRSEEGILSYSSIEDRILDVVHSGRPPPPLMEPWRGAGGDRCPPYA